MVIKDSIKTVAGMLAFDLMAIYKGNMSGQIPGMLPFPGYYWWESGAMWGIMIDYWFYTDDSRYNHLVQEGLLFQSGPKWDYMPRNWTLGMGNDDQGKFDFYYRRSQYAIYFDEGDQNKWRKLARGN
jgi:mannan endo-1,6-alpha-mannosidase